MIDGNISRLLGVLQQEEQGFLAGLCPRLGLTSAFHGKPSLCLPVWLLAWVSTGVMDGGLDVTQAVEPQSSAPEHAALPAVVCVKADIPCLSLGLLQEMGSSDLLDLLPEQPMRKPTVLGAN